MTKLIVGLGNPGKQYEETRHNVGFKVIDLLATKMEIILNKEKEKAVIGEGRFGVNKVVLVKPMTFMNISGQAVGPLAKWYKVEPKDILVIYDDLDLPVGKLRLRLKGGAGGHNGIKSLIQYLGTEEFPRIKIGIGRPPVPGPSTADYVLGRFASEEIEMVDSAKQKALEAIQVFLEEDMLKAMNRYNC